MMTAAAASPDIDVELVGDKALQVGLRNSRVVMSKGLIKALARSAEKALPTAMGLAPRGKTGQLAASLRANVSGPGAISSVLPYAAPRHWGWAEKGMNESLFVVQGMRQTEPQWLRYFDKVVEEALDVAGTGRSHL